MKKSIILAIAVMMLFSASLMAQSGMGQGKANCVGFGHGGGRGHHGMGQGGSGMKQGHRAGMILRLADELELTNKQQSDISAMIEKFALVNIDKEAELKKAHVQMRSLKAKDASEGEVFAMMDKISALKLDMRKTRYTNHKAIKSVLTEDQQNKLKELRPKFAGIGGGQDCDGDGPHGKRGKNGKGFGKGRFGQGQGI